MKKMVFGVMLTLIGFFSTFICLMLSELMYCDGFIEWLDCIWEYNLTLPLLVSLSMFIGGLIISWHEAYVKEDNDKHKSAE